MKAAERERYQGRALIANGVYVGAEVAELVFRHPPDWFYRRRLKLIAEEGFPRPISKFGQPRWSGAALIAWMSRQPCEAIGADLPGAPDLSNVLDMRTAAMKAGRDAKRHRRNG